MLRKWFKDNSEKLKSWLWLLSPLWLSFGFLIGYFYADFFCPVFLGGC